MFRWLHDSVGTNWRLSGPQAAIGLAQLAKLADWTAARTRNAAIYTQALKAVRGLRVPTPRDGVTHAYYRHYFYIDAPEGEAERLRAEILRRAAEANLRLFSGSCSEVYREEAFAALPAPDCPVAKALTGSSLTVEVHPTLRPDLTERRAEALARIATEVLG
jgi:dTDP-4-amino-4,6-dideoxygalactose transaminase